MNIGIHIAGNLYCRFVPFLARTLWNSRKQDLARGRIADRNRLGVRAKIGPARNSGLKRVSWLKKMDEALGPGGATKSGRKKIGDLSTGEELYEDIAEVRDTNLVRHVLADSRCVRWR